MNCKPHQLAWIAVPPQYRGSGLEQLNGHVVRTQALAPGYPDPTWRITPPQVVTFKTFTVDHSGQPINAGETRWTEDIPDSFLRPFDPKSEPEADLEQRELEHTA